MERPNFGTDYLHEEIDPERKLALYFDLSEKCMDLISDKVWQHKGSFITYKRIGGNYENNIEFEAILKFLPKKEAHEIKDISFSINEVEPCIGGAFNQVVKSSTLSFHERELSYSVDYYLVDDESGSMIKVCLDEQSDNFGRKVGKKLQKLDDDYEKGKLILTEFELNHLYCIINEIVLAENETNNNNDYYAEDDDEGYYD